MLAFCTEAVGEESVRVRTVFFTHCLPAKLSKRRGRGKKRCIRHGSARPLERGAV